MKVIDCNYLRYIMIQIYHVLIRHLVSWTATSVQWVRYVTYRGWNEWQYQNASSNCSSTHNSQEFGAVKIPINPKHGGFIVHMEGSAKYGIATKKLQLQIKILYVLVGNENKLDIR